VRPQRSEARPSCAREGWRPLDFFDWTELRKDHKAANQRLASTGSKAIVGIFNVRFVQADVLDIIAEMKQRVVQVIFFGAKGKFFYWFVKPNTCGVIHARPRFVAELALSDRRQGRDLDRGSTCSEVTPAFNRADAQLSKPKPISNSAFQLNNHAFEPGLFEPKSLLPGNGIFRAETKRPKRLQRVRDAVAETKSR
jgi:hypothetical protein